MAKKHIIISFITIAVLAFGVICMSGVTLALDFARNDMTGNITTAGLNLSATAKNVAVYTAEAASAGDEGAFAGDHGDYYIHRQCNVQNSDGMILFGNRSGGVSWNEKSVSIENMMPGDLVEFDIEVKSSSNIAFNYRAELYVNADEGGKLYNQLDFSAGTLGLLRKDVSGESGIDDDTLAEAVFTDYTEWTKKSASQTDVETVRVSVSLPITAKEGQGEGMKLYYVVRGEQNTEMQGDFASVVSPTGETVSFKKLYTGDPENLGAVDYALRNGISTVNVIGNNIIEEGTVRISRALRLVGVMDEEGNYPTVNGARIIVENGATLAVENVNFDGASYIDVSGAMGLTLSGCTIDVTPEKLYDETRRDFVSDAAFLVSATSLTPVRLNVTNNRFFAKHGAAIALRSPFLSGSVIAENQFGSANGGYDGTAVLVFNGAENLESPEEHPVITVSQNSFYGAQAFYLGSSAGTNEYMVSSNRNTAHGIAQTFASGATQNGVALASFTDFGSTANGLALRCGDIAYENMLFCGVDITCNNFNLIATGTVALSEHISREEFYDRYTIGSELKDGDVVFYGDNA